MGRSKDSSVPGLIYFSNREATIPTADGFLEGRRNCDGAENLWRIGNNLYDLNSFVKLHPGGQEWITLTKGTDITDLFETHHITTKAERLLPKFFIREAKTERATPWTFEKNNFYNKFKERAREALKDVDFHKPSIKSNRIADSLMLITLIACILAAKTESWSSIIIAGILAAWTTVCGHNYIHMRDNFRMFYFDIFGMSSRDWRITHIFSHHMYTNTVWDFEIYVLEPYLQYLPRADKPFLPRCFGGFYIPVAAALFVAVQIFNRYYRIFSKQLKMELRDYVPFVIPSLLFIFGSSFKQTILIYSMIISVAGYAFHFTGLNAAHHHPDIFHDGDRYRDNFDWGLLEMDATRDRPLIDRIYFFGFINFGWHCLHHLLPTVDHGYLSLCQEALEKTCEEFGIKSDVYTPWELMKGQFQQLSRVQRNENLR